MPGENYDELLCLPVQGSDIELDFSMNQSGIEEMVYYKNFDLEIEFDEHELLCHQMQGLDIELDFSMSCSGIEETVHYKNFDLEMGLEEH